MTDNLEESYMVKEFEGKTETEAIEKAIEALGIDRDEIDVEILEEGKKGLFKKGPVKIRVHIQDIMEEEILEIYQNYKSINFKILNKLISKKCVIVLKNVIMNNRKV